ncbi:MFS transporter [Candidatus Xianfuyuplasma coldseepsis]|uniref:MFS transporter n=1 Tax=Candidatus Xianfuyuplasma coldseepsis TaxID=2782163 RepID=A0A7L7KNY3_9MOLU|nr:MFS transporter [Xianfuyuplasma coldseepsis]QMS84481.1 MFS transporter [Xianfuyuplasma coldseepsis]
MIYLAQAKSFDLWQLGIFESVFHISSISSEVPTGMIGDLLGRKVSRLLGILFYIIYLIIILFSSNFWIIGIGFVICGISYTFESGSGDALIYDTLIELNEQDKYMKVQGIKEIIFQLSSSIALPIGGMIAIIAYNLNFEIMIIVFVVASIPILLMKEIPLNVEYEHKRFTTKMYEHFVKSTKTVFSSTRLVFLLSIGALLAAPITTLFFYLQNFYIDNYSIFTIGIILGASSIMGIIGGYSAHIIERKYKEKLVLYIVPIFIVILLWLILFEEISYIPFILLGFFDSIFYVVLSDYINRITPSSQRATILSFNNMAFSLVMIIVFPLVGIISEFSTLMTGFAVLAGLATLAYLSLLFLLSKIDISE